MLCLNTWFMSQLEDEISKGTYSSQKLDKRFRRQLKTFNGLRDSAKQPRFNNLTDFDLLLIPINQCQSHWLLVVLDLRNMHVYIIDSMTATVKRAEHYTKCLSRVIND